MSCPPPHTHTDNFEGEYYLPSGLKRVEGTVNFGVSSGMERVEGAIAWSVFKATRYNGSTQIGVDIDYTVSAYLTYREYIQNNFTSEERDEHMAKLHELTDDFNWFSAKLVQISQLENIDWTKSKDWMA